MNKVAFWKHFPVDDQGTDSLINATLSFDQQYDLDVIKITPAGSWLATCYGLVDTWQEDHLGRRTITGRCIANENDWLNLPLINDSENLIDTYITVAERLKEKNQVKPIFTTVFCPVSQAIQMAGIERFKEHILEAPQKVQKGLERITENTLAVLERFAKAGTTGNYFVTQAMQNGMLTPSEYELWGQPYDKVCLVSSARLFEYSIFHIHGEDIYFSLHPSGKDAAIHFEFNSTVAAAAKRLDNNLLPGISAAELARITIETEALQMVKSIETSVGRPMQMLTAGCVLPLNFPDQQIHFWKDIMYSR